MPCRFTRTNAHAHQCCIFQSYAKTVPSRMKLTMREPASMTTDTWSRRVTSDFYSALCILYFFVYQLHSCMNRMPTMTLYLKKIPVLKFPYFFFSSPDKNCNHILPHQGGISWNLSSLTVCHSLSNKVTFLILIGYEALLPW